MKPTTQDTSVSSNEDVLWTARDVQHYFQISPATYFRWVAEGKIEKGIRIGRTVRHCPAEIRKVGQ